METDGIAATGIRNVAMTGLGADRRRFTPANDGAADLAPGNAPLADHHLIDEHSLDGEFGESVLCEVFTALVDLLHHIRAGDFDLEAANGPGQNGSASPGV